MNIIEDGTDLMKWRSVDKTISELPNNFSVYLNPGFDGNNYEMKSKKCSNSTKQSPLEMLFETCKNIGHTLGLDKPIQNRKRNQQDSKDEENFVSGNKKQSISHSYHSKSPPRISINEERKVLKSKSNVSIRTIPDSSGSPRISNENGISSDRNSSQLLSSSLIDSSINIYQNSFPHNILLNKNIFVDSNYNEFFNNFSKNIPSIIDSHQRLSCDCFLCLFLYRKYFLPDLSSFHNQSKLNVSQSMNLEAKSEMFSTSIYKAINERPASLGIEYCMYCGIHCPSIQILLHHIHHAHLV